MNYRLRKFISTLVDASTSDVPSQLPSGLPSISVNPSGVPSETPSGVPSTQPTLSDVPSQLPTGLPSTSSAPSFSPTSECLLDKNSCEILAQNVAEAAKGLGDAEAKEDKCCPKPSTSPSFSLAPSSQPTEFCPDPDTLTDECKTELVTKLCHND